MHNLFQCVPNISEGRRLDAVKKIADAVSSVSGAELLDYSSDPDHNRSVFTLAGDENALFCCIEELFKAASRFIDMREHDGVHPRIGAVDVVPFVPLLSTSMEAAQKLCLKSAEHISKLFGIPIYLYGRNAVSEKRARLAFLRRGGFEALKGIDLSADERCPDLGPSRLHETLGASCFGARRPLIAFNVILNTNSKITAERIASAVRESSGGIIGVQALGFYLASKDKAQVSVNITDTDRVSLKTVFDAVCAEAEKYGTEVINSELIGVCSASALCSSAADYLKLPGLCADNILESGLMKLF